MSKPLTSPAETKTAECPICLGQKFIEEPECADCRAPVDTRLINTDTERYLEMVRDGSIVSYVRARDEEIRRLKQARVDLHDEVTELEAENKRLRAALEGLTNAALADIKPLPSQVEAAFEALKAGGR